MPDGDFVTPLLSEFNTKLRDMEEKQRLLKERVLLIGQNLVESKENLEKTVTELKIYIEEMKLDISRLKASVIRVGEELDNKARRSDLEILEKQFKMFKPIQIKREQNGANKSGKRDENAGFQR